MLNIEKLKERKRKYYIENKERILADRRKTRKENPEKERKSSLKWYHNNKEQALASAKRWQQTNKTALQAYRRKYKFALTTEQWNELFVKQGNCCAACKIKTLATKRGWHTDHDHVTGKVRGILCHHCNLALGHVQDDIAKLQSLIEYLKNESSLREV